MANLSLATEAILDEYKETVRKIMYICRLPEQLCSGVPDAYRFRLSALAGPVAQDLEVAAAPVNRLHPGDAICRCNEAVIDLVFDHAGVEAHLQFYDSIAVDVFRMNTNPLINRVTLAQMAELVEMPEEMKVENAQLVELFQNGNIEIREEEETVENYEELNICERCDGAILKYFFI